MKSIYNLKFLKLLVSLSLIALSITGSECNEILEDNSVIPQEIVGDWKLIEQTGALQDICPDENVNFQSGGVATLTCPNASAITRNFEVVNSVLTYTQTNISYGLQILDNGKLLLTGQNVSRNLKYEKIITADRQSKAGTEQEALNSSEGGIVK